MASTDYSQIATRYDNNPIRHNHPKEIIIEQLLKLQTGSINFLDLGCGTGNYLQAQQNIYTDNRINWFGCDLSKDMLEIAHAKLPFVELCEADAATLPYKDDFFNVVTCNFAFHHFNNKKKCVKEMHRVLKAKGVFLMNNICPEYMPLSWVYHYFPSTRKIDKEYNDGLENIMKDKKKNDTYLGNFATIRCVARKMIGISTYRGRKPQPND